MKFHFVFPSKKIIMETAQYLDKVVKYFTNCAEDPFYVAMIISELMLSKTENVYDVTDEDIINWAKNLNKYDMYDAINNRLVSTDYINVHRRETLSKIYALMDKETLSEEELKIIHSENFQEAACFFVALDKANAMFNMCDIPTSATRLECRKAGEIYDGPRGFWWISENDQKSEKYAELTKDQHYSINKRLVKLQSILQSEKLALLLEPAHA